MSAMQFARILGVRVSNSQSSNLSLPMAPLDFPAIQGKGFARILKGETKEKIIFNHSPSAWVVRNRGLFVKVTE